MYNAEISNKKETNEYARFQFDDDFITQYMIFHNRVYTT